ncbi:hypothetical protein TraAM80_01713 [Trypanosoma rangeli]|uniref:Uncharacterized protein n=1 Tax=Trypanosoma rangeli TaxID=5698 RepID=A0A422NXW9_TRYRA|nr:uncharacterized protein TraAM80_01713 [Trypanosoma rangeli]RNF10353.1 hypothetical protein TraAM80_01713 [Trypanosoma rangeli]|eukprot:RNF10353.1 hypothetical protein TraAM80_01713 [Trypanosoma rangeli]
MLLADEEKQFDNEASYYAKEEQCLCLAAASETDDSSSNKPALHHLLQPFHECDMCKDLRPHINSLEPKLRESYDNHCELLNKLHRNQFSPPSHLRIILSSSSGDGEKERLHNDRSNRRRAGCAY